MAPFFLPNHTLVGRYRIVELLGAGDTAEVYLAEDESLHRQVVAKVLLADLAAHESVRRAFRDHIIRASTLSHPYLARVFDGGQESGSIFMISEYLSGGSFEDVLRTGRRLSVDESARLGRDVASALGYVHHNGFVLGSLSPSKLLVDGDGRVRVSDVALAGLSAGHRTRLSLDDARYLSPEQAVGEAATAVSDVYSLALILFEAVTGVAAFEGATAEAILRARLSAPLPVRLELGTLDMVLAQAAVPDPRLRLDAEQFSTRLGAVVSDAAPLVLRAKDAAAPLLVQFEAPEVRRTIGFQPPSPDQIVAGARTSRVRANVSSESLGPSTGALGHSPRFDRSGYDLPQEPPRRGLYLAVAVALVILAIILAVAWRAGLFASTHRVPPLVGLTVPQASTALEGDGFTLSVVHQVRSSKAPGDIVSQSPLAGTSAKSGLVIAVGVSEGLAPVTLPTHLVGESCARATAQLSALHVAARCPTSAAVYSSLSRGDVARVLYHRTANPLAVPRGARVVLVASKGARPSATTTTPSTTAPPATSTSTSTTTSTAPVASPRAVPNVVGDDYAQTYAAMKRAGFYFSTTGPHAGTTTWTAVVSENPSAGTVAPYKSTVALTVR